MEISVIGNGNIGKTIVRLLVREKFVTRIKCLDINENSIRSLVANLNSKKVVGEIIDASDIDSITDAIIDSNIVINATKPWFNDNIMRACIWTGAHYIDLSSVNILEQIEYDRLWKRNGLIGILSMGEDPGISNILAKYISDQLDEIESIKIRDGGEASYEGLNYTFAMDVAIEDLIFKAGVYKNGKLYRVPSLSGKENYKFPIVGKKQVYFADHEEPYTLPYFLGKEVKYVDFKIYVDKISVILIKYLKKLGLFREHPIIYDDKEIIPIYFFEHLQRKTMRSNAVLKGHEIVVVDVEGYKNGNRQRVLGYIYMTHQEARKRFNTTATSYLTAVPAVIAAKMIAKKAITEPGIYVPEQLDYNYFLKELKRYNIIPRFEGL